MASGAKKGGGGGGGDVILESRHLVGLFLMMVVIFGVVFVLGYELGRNQVSGQVRASDATQDENTSTSAGTPSIVPPATSAPVMQPPPATPPATNRTASAPPKAAPNTTNNAGTKNNIAKNGTVQPPPKTNSSKSQPAPPASNRTVAPPSNAAKNSPLVSSPNSSLIPKGSVVLQVAALTVESDALKMAQELQKKKFPAFVLAPGADHFYHVQVGPYTDAKAVDKARAALEKEGFKPIVKH
jgi:hypothetical protein